MKLPETKEDLCLFALSDGKLPGTNYKDRANWVKRIIRKSPDVVKMQRAIVDHYTYNIQVIEYSIYVCDHLIESITGFSSIGTESFRIYHTLYEDTFKHTRHIK